MRNKSDKKLSEAGSFISERMNEILAKYKGDVSMAAFFVDNVSGDMIKLANGKSATVAMAMHAAATEHADFELALITAAMLRILARNGGDVVRSMAQVRELYDNFISERSKSAKNLPN